MGTSLYLLILITRLNLTPKVSDHELLQTKSCIPEELTSLLLNEYL